MLLDLIVKTPTFLISLSVTNKSSVTFSKNNPQKTPLTIGISRQIDYPNVDNISFPLFFFPKSNKLYLPNEKRCVTGSCTVLESSWKNSQSKVYCNSGY